MLLRLVSSSGANAFMTELLAILATELCEQGVDAQLVMDRFPPVEPGIAYVVIPHEFVATVPARDHPSTVQLARTIALTTEQPGSGWFDKAATPAAACARIADISTVGVTEWRRRGLDAEHLQLGYAAAWDTWHGDEAAERDLDVLVLASMNRRRAHYLAGCAAVLAEHETYLALAPIEPKHETDPGVFLGAGRSALLARSKIALHIRMLRPPYFEWLRAIQALSAGAVLLSEHSAGHAPLVAGEHFVAGSPENLGLLADALLRDPDELARLRRSGYAALREGPSMAAAARRLAELAEPLAGAPVGRPWAATPQPVDMADPAIGDPADDAAPTRMAISQLAFAVETLGRRVATLDVERQGLDPAEIVTVATTPAFADADPRITVALRMHEDEQSVADALAAVAVQDIDEPLELLILDDASTDRSVAVAQTALDRRPWLPAQALSRRVGAGRSRDRNELLSRARGEYVLILDADDALYPQALRRLVVALDAADDALFAYGALDCWHDGEPDGVRAYLPWDPDELRDDHPLAGLVLLRRDAVVGLGGYRDGAGVSADHDLWRRIAEHGGRGEQVATFIARHRRTDTAMLALSNS